MKSRKAPAECSFHVLKMLLQTSRKIVFILILSFDFITQSYDMLIKWRVLGALFSGIQVLIKTRDILLFSVNYGRDPRETHCIGCLKKSPIDLDINVTL